jgi:acyl-CoA thioester hydrolase
MTFDIKLRVYWEDTDAGGIVFFANYLKFFERARTEWLRSCGIAQQALREEVNGLFVVSESSVKYLRPARLDDELTITARLVEKGRASITIEQEAWCRTTGEPVLLCTGRTRIGWVAAATLKPERIPEHVIQRLQ